MLAADKLLLQSNVKQRAIQLREKELSLFNDNFNTVGTQSAVLAGFAMTSFAEIDLPHNAFYAQKVRVLHVDLPPCPHLAALVSGRAPLNPESRQLSDKCNELNQCEMHIRYDRVFIELYPEYALRETPGF